MSTLIKVHIRIEGGALLSAANQKRIRVTSTTPDRCVIWPGKPANYCDSYVLMHEPKGFIFREINHGCGISGHFPTVRQAVIAAARHGLKIEVCDEPISDAMFERTAAVVEWAMDSRSRSYPAAA
jgi:hypothetical protein